LLLTLLSCAAQAQVNTASFYNLQINQENRSFIRLGSGFFQPPFVGDTYETRVIGGRAEHRTNHFFGSRTVTPEQTVTLKTELYFDVTSTKLGEANLNGLTYGVYAVPNSPYFGFITDVKITGVSSSVSDYSMGIVPLNHEGMPSDTNLWADITSGTSFSTFQYPYFWVVYRTHLVWLGPIPITSDMHSQMPSLLGGTDNALLFQSRYRSQDMNNGVVEWQPLKAGPSYRILFWSWSAYYYPTIGTCTTPPMDQLVNLPMVHANEFTGEGVTHGETNFDLTFGGCSQYMNAIRYKFYSTHPADNTDALNAAKGLVSLNNIPGSATGIKVQILDRNTNQPITLDQFRVAPQYTGYQSSFTIPFKARYYQSESQVTGGKVRATAFFQIIYQ